MIVVGLTGSIAMGKTTTAAMLRQAGFPVHDADAVVHRLLAAGGVAVPAVLRRFPETAADDGGVDRIALGAQVFREPTALRQLEAILHPLVGQAERRFLRRTRAQGRAVAVLDIPLLFEAGSERRCDAVILVSAPAFLQRARALKRHGMNPAKFAAILARQMPDRLKRRRTRYIVETGLGRRFARRQLMAHMCQIIKGTGNEASDISA